MLSELTTVFLVILLIGTFVLAFKLMEAVFEVITVSLLSAAFYISLWYIFSYNLTTQNLVLFAFLGASFYIVYTVIASVYTVGSSLVSIPIAFISELFDELKQLARALNQKIEERAEKQRDKKNNRTEEGNSEEEENVKEVVIDKVQDED